MAYIAFISGIVSGNFPKLAVLVQFKDSTGLVENPTIDIPVETVTTWAQLRAAAETAIDGYATANSFTVTSKIWTTEVVKALTNAPQAAIADAPADATTNYNVVTTLLGSLTGAVNTANTKQNDIATKLNTVLSALRTLGLISA